MEIILVIIAFILLALGFLGAVLPVLPGPPLSYAGLLLIRLSGFGDFSAAFLLIWAGIVIIVTIMDYFLPSIMTKRFGGSRAAALGSFLGLVAGIFFFPPLGIIIGPFLGAFIGEMINNSVKAADAGANADTDAKGANALKVAFGAFVAFIVGSGAKLIICSLMFFQAIRAVF